MGDFKPYSALGYIDSFCFEKSDKYESIKSYFYFTNNFFSFCICFCQQSIQAKYYLALADAYRSQGSFLLARDAVFSALKLRSGWGEAYINLGNIYVAGAKSCGDDFETQTVYWVAVDAFKKALSDPETEYRASKSINTYSKYFPTKENCFFNGLEAGTQHTVACWINKTTTARTSD